jgi:DNA-binding NarL/FixJ family response regulator
VKNVVLCSSHPILTAGFSVMLEQSGEFRPFVCPSAAHLADCPGKCADIILIDATPGMTLDTLSEARLRAPGAAVVLWIDSVSTEFAAQAISLGVLGILRKNSPIHIHFQCLHSVSAGQPWVESDLNIGLLRNIQTKLSPRERQLASLLTQGLKNKEIASRLGITQGTVKVYFSRLYKKVGASDRFELALFVLKNLSPDQAPMPGRMPPSSVPAKTPALPGFLNMERVPAQSN